MEPIHEIINHSTPICPFESRKRGKGGNYKKLNISRVERAFLMNKKHFL